MSVLTIDDMRLGMQVGNTSVAAVCDLGSFGKVEAITAEKMVMVRWDSGKRSVCDPMYLDDPNEPRIEPMPELKRVKTKGGSHIEPEYDNSWPVERRLAWNLGVFKADTGIRATLGDSHYTSNGRRVLPIHYNLSFAGMGMTCGNERETSRTLSTLAIGVEVGRKLANMPTTEGEK